MHLHEVSKTGESRKVIALPYRWATILNMLSYALSHNWHDAGGIIKSKATYGLFKIGAVLVSARYGDVQARKRRHDHRRLILIRCL